MRLIKAQEAYLESGTARKKERADSMRDAQALGGPRRVRALVKDIDFLLKSSDLQKFELEHCQWK